MYFYIKNNKTSYTCIHKIYKSLTKRKMMSLPFGINTMAASVVGLEINFIIKIYTDEYDINRYDFCHTYYIMILFKYVICNG